MVEIPLDCRLHIDPESGAEVVERKEFRDSQESRILSVKEAKGLGGREDQWEREESFRRFSGEVWESFWRVIECARGHGGEPIIVPFWVRYYCS